MANGWNLVREEPMPAPDKGGWNLVKEEPMPKKVQAIKKPLSEETRQKSDWTLVREEPIAKTRLSSIGDYIPKEIKDIPKEIVDATMGAAKAGIKDITEKTQPSSVFDLVSTFNDIVKTGKGLVELGIGVPAAPIVGAARSIGGHALERLPDALLGRGPGAAKITGQQPQGTKYDTAKEMVDTALMAAAPGEGGGPKTASVKAAAKTPKGPWELVREEPLKQEKGKTSAISSEMLAKQPQEVARTPEGFEHAEEKPATDMKQKVSQLSDELFTLRQSGVADRAEIGNYLKSFPEEMRSPVLQEKLYHAAEDPKVFESLAPAEKQMFEQYIQPMRKELNTLYNKVKGYGVDVEDPNYMHRMVKGRTPQYDTADTGGAAYDPIQGTRSLPRTTGALKERKFFAIEDAQGNRKVVSKGDEGFNIWNDGKPTKIKSSFNLEPGENVEAGGKQWTVKQARTAEIEANSPTQYHKNAAVNTADALVRMREASRNIDYLEGLKKNPEFLEYAQLNPKAGGNKEVPRGWEAPKLPQFHDWVMDPKIRAVFDDFYRPGFEGLEGLRKINKFATGSIFWSPIPHIENVAAHWFVGRGWDWIKPGPIKNFATDAGRAIRAVITQNEDYQKMLRKGSGLVSGGQRNADFYQQMAKRFGMEIEKNWGSWKPTFDKLGLGKPYEAVAWWYDKVRDVLWQANDMFMLHRQFELMRQGLSETEAIKEAEKDIPNYRIPTEVLGSRGFSQLMQDPSITMFSRYHYGLWKAYMNTVTDMAKGSSKEKVDALGKMAALGVLLYVVYPVLDYAIQRVTGDVNARKLRRGSATIPEAIKDMYNGDMQLPNFIANTLTLSPAIRETWQQGTNLDFFTGKHIYEPGDWNDHRYDKTGVQAGEHALGSLVGPYGTATQILTDRPGAREAGRALFDTLVGAKNTSERTLRGRQTAKAFQARGAAKRKARPRGPLEKAYNSLGVE